MTIVDAHPSAGSPPIHRRITRCRACDGEDLHPVLDLGLQPLANALPSSPAEFAGEARYPLVLCHCPGCGLVQLVDVIDPEVLFGHYLYVTGTSTTIAEHNVRYAGAVQEHLALGPDDLVVEVASNDGSLLRCFQARGVRVLGVEPARNIAAIARAQGVPTESLFFDRAAGADLRTRIGPARVVIGNNVLAHVGDPVGFLAGAAALLGTDGRAIVEVPYLEEMLDRLEYDTIYHEHLCYFSVGALLTIAERAGLRVVRVDRVPVHGGSIRTWFAPEAAVPGHAPEVLAMVERERERGLADPARLARFAADVAANRRALRALLERLRSEGASVAGYGAPAKGNTLLNYCDIGTDLVAYTVDRSPLKQHRYTPGTHLPIHPPEVLLERRPDYVLILAWNFADEIMAQQAEYHRGGGRFILPVPVPTIRS
jgi:hypothetical protein